MCVCKREDSFIRLYYFVSKNYFNFLISFFSYFEWKYIHIWEKRCECPVTWLGDEKCDPHCNVEECDFDGGDCGNH